MTLKPTAEIVYVKPDGRLTYDGLALFEDIANSVSGGGGAWGSITGTLSAQTDLQTALNGKAAMVHTHVAADVTDFTEASQDAVGAALQAPLIYNDGANQVTFDQTTALGNVARTTVRKNSGSDVGSRRRLNLIEGSNVTLTVTDDGGNEEVDVTIDAATNVDDNYCVLAANYTLSNSAALQKLFNTTTNGTVTLSAGNYEVFGLIYVTTMSATSGNALIDLLGAGTATVSNWLWMYDGIDSSTPLNAAARSGGMAASKATVASWMQAGTGTAMHGRLHGMVMVSSSGTLIPSIQLVTAAAAVVQAGSYINFRRVGAHGSTTKGAWS